MSSIFSVVVRVQRCVPAVGSDVGEPSGAAEPSEPPVNAAKSKAKGKAKVRAPVLAPGPPQAALKEAPKAQEADPPKKHGVADWWDSDGRLSEVEILKIKLGAARTEQVKRRAATSEPAKRRDARAERRDEWGLERPAGEEPAQTLPATVGYATAPVRRTMRSLKREITFE